MTVRFGLRRVAAAFAAAALVTGAAACSGDDTDETTTTTEADGEQSSETTTTLSDGDYAEEVDSFAVALEDAEQSGDLCTVIAVPNESAPPEPANQGQMEQVIELYADVLRAYGATVGDAELAAGFDQMAEELVAEAQAAGYPLDFLETQPEALTNDAATALQTRFTDIAMPRCMPDMDEPGEGDLPEEAPIEGDG